ncbi:hypothetical protein J7T55_011146 [Diaporthe amygdali]|uniref:uncharacterized protein n=1 Tax=Phomopsis amygdali TaxID=1214568 RepID=UPI0022FF3549|nr:uncharacterized protein J7T55_011146 [Diaporthe amygdali]KAJ0104362.1 hypothetical protein J7T55_011146 [Diaporthe amygdali]
MSAAQSHFNIKALPADLRPDLFHRGIGPEPDSNLHAYSLNRSHYDNSVHATSHQQGFADTALFTQDFAFSTYQGLRERSSISSAVSEEHAPGLFANRQRQSISSTMADTQVTAPSITAHAPYFGTADSNRGRSSVDGSDDGSPDANHNGHSLEDPVSDEFGLTSLGPGDGTDLGAKHKDDKSDTAPAWTRKAAPRTDYMAMLDKRLKRMEERIIKIVPKNEQDGISSAVPRAVVKPAIPGTLSSGKGNSRKRGAEEAFGQDLDNWAKVPTKPSLESPPRPTSLMMVHESEETKLLQEGVQSLPSREIQEHLADVFFESVYGQAYHILHKPSYMRKLRAGTLPPVLILSVCAMSARFSNHPKLNTSPAFLRGEEWAAAARDIVTKRYEWPNITILTCLLILGLHEFATCHGGRSWALAGQAIRMAFALQLHKDLEYDPLRPGTRLSFTDREIRRRTMWACFLMDRFNSSGTDRPTFIKEETLRIPLPIKEKNFQFEDMPGLTENLQGEVPNSAALEGMEKEDAKNNMGVAAYMIKAVAIWGRVINYLNQGGKDLDDKPMWDPDSEYMKLIKQAEDMATSLPESLVYNPDNLHLHDTEGMANQFLFLHIAIQQNILFLSRFAVSSPNANSLQDIPKSFVTKAGAKAFCAANRISELLKDSESCFITAPFVGYCAFLSSTVHIFGIFSGNPTIEATSKRNLAINIKSLSKMKRFWGMFHFMTENLRDQYRNCADAARRGTLPGDASSSPIFQYGDWFDRYPHGVSQSDFVDPAIYKKKEKGEDAVLEQKPELHTVEEFFTTLSPQTKEAGARSNSMSMKKAKALAAKRHSISSARSDPHGTAHGLEPLMTDMNADQLHRLQQQGRYPGAALGGQTSRAASFSALSAAPHSAAYHGTISPISPVTVGHGQFGGGGGHHGMYGHDMLSLQLAQNGMLPHSMLGPSYVSAGLDPTATAAMMDGLPGWDGADNNNGGGREASRGSADGPHNNPHHTVFGHGHDGGSAAWFMPFNSTEVGDVGLASAIDGFGSMFGSGAGGHGSGMGGGH